MVKKLAVILFFALGVLFAPVPTGAEPPVHILLDDVDLEFDTPPVIIEGRTIVPFRTIAEALGVQVSWDGTTYTVSAQGKGKNISLKIGEKQALVNSQLVKLDVAAQIISNRTMVPLRFFSEVFGAKVDWNGETRTVNIVSPPSDLYTMAFYAIHSFDERQLVQHFDTVAFGWSRLTAEGRLDLSGQDYRWPEAAGEITPERILADAKKAKTNCYLMVYMGDGKGELTRLLSNEVAIRSAAREINKLVNQKGFDGVILDLEGLGMTGTDKDILDVRTRFNSLVKEISQTLKPQGKKLAVALHPLNSAYRGYDYHTIGEYADEIVVMAYDYNLAGGPEPNEMVQEALKLAIHEVPADKLLLGISVWSENPESIKGKLGLAKRYGLKGVALWRLGLIGNATMQAIESSINMK